MKELKDGWYLFTIAHAKTSDAGTYTCTATNSLGQASCVGKLTLFGTLTMLECSEDDDSFVALCRTGRTELCQDVNRWSIPRGWHLEGRDQSQWLAAAKINLAEGRTSLRRERSHLDRI